MRQALRAEDTGLPDGFGPFEGTDGKGKWFHGTPGDHVFHVIRRPFGDGTNPGNKIVVRNWNPVEDTALPAEQFCGHCRFTEHIDGADHYICLGHELVERREAVDAAGRPVVKAEPADDDGAPGLPGRDRVRKE